MNRRYIFAILIIILEIATSYYIGTKIPEGQKIPIHWNIRGEADGFAEKWTGFYIFPLINAVILLLMIFMPYFSVRWRNASERFERIIPSITNIIVFFFALIHIYSMILATGWLEFRINLIFPIMGVMFILLGNIMPKIPSNFFAGFRTPWTLSSETVWRKTHRLGGFCFIAGGLLMIIIPLIWLQSPTAMIIMFVIFMIVVLFPAFYSLWLYKKTN